MRLNVGRANETLVPTVGNSGKADREGTDRSTRTVHAHRPLHANGDQEREQGTVERREDTGQDGGKGWTAMEALMPSAEANRPLGVHPWGERRAAWCAMGGSGAASCREEFNAEPTTPRSEPGTLQARLHPAWMQLTQFENAKLAWRRAACQATNACAVSELAHGGMLQILQRAGLKVPPRTKGAVNAYVTANLTDELGRAVQVYLTTATDTFYAVCPKENINYGGKGAGQQLWWSIKADGWRVTQPNRLAHRSDALKPGANQPTTRVRRRSVPAKRPKKEKRQRVALPTTKREEMSATKCAERLSGADPIPISDEDICLLPVHNENELGALDLNQAPPNQQAFCELAIWLDTNQASDSKDTPWDAEEPLSFTLGSNYPLFDESDSDGCETPDVFAYGDKGESIQNNQPDSSHQHYTCSAGLHAAWTVQAEYGASQPIDKQH